MIASNKLMIGDFVKSQETGAILSIFALHELTATGIDTMKAEQDISYDDIIGLPLCDDILNIDTKWEDIFDTKCHREPGMLIHENLGLFKVKNKYYLGLYYYDGVEKLQEIKYVHELQHILSVFNTTMAANILNVDYVYTMTPMGID